MSIIVKDVNWLPKPNEKELVFGEEVPDPELICAAFAFVFNNKGELLLVEEVGKGTFDVPGGGRDAGETFEQTAKREILEEAFVDIEDVELVAYQKITVNGEKPEKYRRPYPVAYEVFVKAKLKAEHEFQKNEETVSRKFFRIEEAFKQEGVVFGHRSLILEKCI